MTSQPEPSLGSKIKDAVIGRARSPHEPRIFHSLSLAAFFAWIGLGADGLSSSCYGPPEAFIALGHHPFLGIFIALATALTIFVIASSYQQIIELFPSGGGGYVVASKLLSPRLGMLAGCALMVDYVLTIAVSIASGADALFSFLPVGWGDHKLAATVLAAVLLTILNLRGVRESVGPLVPIFMTFLLTHALLIVYAMVSHFYEVPTIWHATVQDVRSATGEMGLAGMLLFMMHAYSMGAGTYTGIEAVSNGMPILREPRVRTAKRTMNYMWISLAVTVLGLMIGYLLFGVHEQEGKTINASLLENVTQGMGTGGSIFSVVTLASEAALLLVAAQTGFLGGPRVLAIMAADRWFPARLSMLSDRLVTQNGILLMSGAAIATILMTGGSVRMLVVLYSINVFITFVLSQSGMVRHWWASRREVPAWRRKLFINGVGLFLSAFILFWITISKFHEGGWVTLLVTGALVALASVIKRHYDTSHRLLNQFNQMAMSVLEIGQHTAPQPCTSPGPCDPDAKTAVLFVSGFNGMGIHSLLNISRFFGETFRNFLFVQIGVVDAGNFKGAPEVDHLKQYVQTQVQQYVAMVRQQGYFADAYTAVGADVVDEAEKLSLTIIERFPQAIFFTGQLLFPRDSFLTRLLHNQIAFALQRRLYHDGIPLMLLPIRVQTGGAAKANTGSIKP